MWALRVVLEFRDHGLDKIFDDLVFRTLTENFSRHLRSQGAEWIDQGASRPEGTDTGCQTTEKEEETNGGLMKELRREIEEREEPNTKALRAWPEALRLVSSRFEMRKENKTSFSD